MILDLEEPFKSIWRKGYLQVLNNEGGRRYVVLFNSDDDRTIISYARYLMSVKLGYVVPSHLEVDHRDDDCTNDDINNLQILTKAQNQAKRILRFWEREEVWGFSCAYCSTYFLLTERVVKMRIAAGVENAYCSRSCASSYPHWARKQQSG